MIFVLYWPYPSRLESRPNVFRKNRKLHPEKLDCPSQYVLADQFELISVSVAAQLEFNFREAEIL